MQPAISAHFFKYYRFDKYGLYAIYNDLLWLSNPQYFEDPYDSNLNFLINKETQNGREFRIRGIQSIRDGLGICCFTGTWSDVRMWTEYADNHTGFCIEYDLNAFEEALNNIGVPMLFEPVYYVDSPYSNTDYNLPEHLEERIGRRDVFNLDAKELDNLTQGIILTKDKKLWAHEKEYRLIMPAALTSRFGESNLMIRESRGYSAKLPSECIKTVFFGAKATEADTRNVWDFLRTIRRGYVETRWVKLSDVRGELVADREKHAEISDILSSGFRLYSKNN